LINDYSEFTIILPTLNEEKTIGEMLRRILRSYRGCSVIVVDDGSEDLTREIVKGFAKQNHRVRLLDRSLMGLERGLTASVIYGILKAGTKYVIVIDADLQHPPEKIRDVAQKLGSGYDLVVANRAKVTNWAAYRKIISRAFMYAGKILLFVEARETCVDIFSGFFGIRRAVFLSVYRRNRKRFVGEGYKVLFDFLKCVDRGTLKIANVPFVFNIREAGSSKASIAQGMALLRSFLT
jgi:dolichol-phosphate mannosyltransferase